MLDVEIEQLIDYLKPPLREVFHLKYIRGFSEKEIAKYLYLQISTVKSRLYRARQQLRTDVNLGFQVS